MHMRVPETSGALRFVLGERCRSCVPFGGSIKFPKSFAKLGGKFG